MLRHWVGLTCILAATLVGVDVRDAAAAGGRDREGTSGLVRFEAHASKKHRRARVRLHTALNQKASWCNYYSAGYLDESGLPRVYEWWTCGGYTPVGATRTR